MIRDRQRLGSILVDRGDITPEQLAAALEVHRVNGKMLGQTMVELDMISDEDLLDALSELFALPRIDVSVENVVKQDAARLIPPAVARRYRMVGVQLRNDSIYVAMANPHDVYALDTIRQATSMQVQPLLALDSQIQAAIERYYPGDAGDGEDGHGEAQVDVRGVEGTAPTEYDRNDPAVIRVVNSVIVHAIRARAREIHIEPDASVVRIRLRTEGRLREIQTPPARLHAAILSRVKDIAGLDVSVTAMPQEGGCTVRVGRRQVDLAVSTLPGILGEKALLRVLNRQGERRKLDALGIEARVLARVQSLLEAPEGLFIVSGPRRSGKTTTLYAALDVVGRVDKSIVTIEDPIEWHVRGATQVHARASQGLSIPRALEAALRQEPDIVMVGTIPDAETLTLALRAAATGHLVVAGLTSAHALAAIERLIALAADPTRNATALLGVLAQRRLRALCTRCRAVGDPSEEVLQALRHQTQSPCDFRFYIARGCEHCDSTGFRGSVAMYELLAITPMMRRMLHASAPLGDLMDQAHEDGMRTLEQEIYETLRRGDISAEDALALLVELEGSE